MKEIVCIVCPNGCNLSVDENGKVKGNKCPRGEEFAIREISHPVRSISSTVKTVFEDWPVLPVKTNGEIPKEKIFEVMKEINKVTINKRLAIGDTVIKNVADTHVDIILTTNILKEN